MDVSYNSFGHSLQPKFNVISIKKKKVDEEGSVKIESKQILK
jgi:hypothetical protein